MKYDGLVVRADFHDKTLGDVNVFLSNVPSEAIVFLCLPSDRGMSLTQDMFKKSLNAIINNPDAICYYGDVDLNIFNVMTGIFQNALFAFKKKVLDNYTVCDIYSFLYHLADLCDVVHINDRVPISYMKYSFKSDRIADYVEENEKFNYSLVVPTKRPVRKITESMGICGLLDKSYFLIKTSDGGGGGMRFRDVNDAVINAWFYRYDFNYSKIHNEFLMNYDVGDYCILVNDDVHLGFFSTAMAIKNLLVPFKYDKRLAVVGAKLYFPNGDLQHIGVKVDRRLGAMHPGRGCQEYPGSEYFDTDCCVTFALVAIDVKKYREIGGMDERLPYDFNDIDYCLRCKKAGYRVLYNPQAKAVHHESLTRKADGKCGVSEDMEYFKNKHGALFA